MTITLRDLRSPAPDTKEARTAELVLLIVLAILCAAVYFRYTLAFVRINDPAAYVYAGRQIAAIGRPVYFDSNNVEVGPYFTLHGFRIHRNPGDAEFFVGYPLGLPLLLSVGELTPFPEALFYVVPFLAVVAVVALAVLGRTLFGPWVGLLAAGLLAFNLDFLTLSTETWSDVPAVAFLLVGTICAIHATRRDRFVTGVLAGALLVYACWIRYAAALALLPLGLYLLATMRGRRKPVRGLAGLAVGLATLSTAVLVSNAFIFGGPLRSGYDPQRGWVPWPAFSWQNFVGRSPLGKGGYQVVVSTLWKNAGFWLVLALVGLVIMRGAEAILVGGTALLIALTFAFYLWPTVDARFVLYALVMAYLSAAVATVYLLNALFRQRALPVVLALVAMLVLWHAPSVDETQTALGGRARSAAATTSRVKGFTQQLEPDAVFLSQQYHDLIIVEGNRSALWFNLLAPSDPQAGSYRVEGYEARLTDVIDRLLQQGKPVYVVKEPANRRFREGAIDPYTILEPVFTLRQVFEDPPVYRVEPSPTPQA